MATAGVERILTHMLYIRTLIKHYKHYKPLQFIVTPCSLADPVSQDRSTESVVHQSIVVGRSIYAVSGSKGSR